MKTIFQKLLFFLLILCGSFSTVSAEGWSYTTPSPGPSFGGVSGIARASYLYTFGSNGYDQTTINSDGTLGTWTTILYPSQAGGAYGMGIATTSNLIYVSGGNSDDGGDLGSVTNGFWFAGFNLDGSLNTTTFGGGYMLSSRWNFASLILNNYLYEFGGYADNAGVYSPLASVEYAPVNTNGTVSTFQYTSSFSKISGAVYLSWYMGNTVFCYGANEYQTVTYLERSIQQSNGTLSSWTVTGGPYSFAGLAALTQRTTLLVIQNFSSYTVLNPVSKIPQFTPTLIQPNFISAPHTLSTHYQPSVISWDRFVYAINGGINEVYDPELPGYYNDFALAADTGSFVYENAPGLTNQPTISWLSTYNGSTAGVISIYFNGPNQGVKMTLEESEWFGSISTDWYEMKAQVCSDDTTYPNDLFAVGVLYNGAYSPPMDISGHGLYSLSSGWSYLYDFQQSYGGTSMYPQLTFKNNDTYPATIYLESVEVEPIAQPGN
jgi:hypothetical protein